MRIDPTQTICGHPAVAIRNALRHFQTGLGSDWSHLNVHLKVPGKGNRHPVGQTEAKRVIVDLAKQGYITPYSYIHSARDRENPTENPNPDAQYYITPKGDRLARATAAAPVHRKTAERQIHALVERLRRLNADPEALDHVRKAVIAGGYLRHEERLNDVDVFVELVRKTFPGGPEEFTEKNMILAEAAEISGKRFPSYCAKLIHAYTEAVRFLKSRSRTIHLNCEELAPDQPSFPFPDPHLVIYEDQRRPRTPTDATPPT